MIPHIREGVIEYLRNPEQLWVESDKVVDKIVSRLPEATKTLAWGCWHSGAWDLDRIIIEIRKFRAQVPHHATSINEKFVDLIFGLETKGFDIERIAYDIRSLANIDPQYIRAQGNISNNLNTFHRQYRK